MKVGDWVRSDQWQVEGEVISFHLDCYLHCGLPAFTLKQRSGYPSVWHIEDFTVAEPKPE